MNTPLIHAIELALREVDAERIQRHYGGDARNHTGPRTVPIHEAAEMIAKALGPFALDWRRIEDGLPTGGIDDGPVGCIVMIAAEYLRPDGSHRNFATGEAEIVSADEGQVVWHWRDGAGIAPNVYAWAPTPKAPAREALIGFAPRHAAPATPPAPGAR